MKHIRKKRQKKDTFLSHKTPRRPTASEAIAGVPVRYMPVT